MQGQWCHWLGWLWNAIKHCQSDDLVAVPKWSCCDRISTDQPRIGSRRVAGSGLIWCADVSTHTHTHTHTHCMVIVVATLVTGRLYREARVSGRLYTVTHQFIWLRGVCNCLSIHEGCTTWGVAQPLAHTWVFLEIANLYTQPLKALAQLPGSDTCILKRKGSVTTISTYICI